MFSRVAILGERNTGTRFVSAFVRLNFDVQLDHRLGWKHAKFVSAPADLLILTVSKRPDNWLKSLYRRPYEMSRRSSLAVDYSLMNRQSPVIGSFSEFIRMTWIAIPRDRVLRETYPTVLDLYHEKLRSYEQAKHRVHIRYEDFIEDMRLDDVPLPRRSREWRVPARSTKQNGRSFETTEEVVARYRRPAVMDPEDARFIANRWALLNEQHGATLAS